PARRASVTSVPYTTLFRSDLLPTNLRLRDIPAGQPGEQQEVDPQKQTTATTAGAADKQGRAGGACGAGGIGGARGAVAGHVARTDRKRTRLSSSHVKISYA